MSNKDDRVMVDNWEDKSNSDIGKWVNGCDIEYICLWE